MNIIELTCALVTLNFFLLVSVSDPFVWPLPKSYTISSKPTVIVSSNFQFIIIGPGNNNSILNDAIERYNNLIFSHTIAQNPPNNTNNIISELLINVSSIDETTLQYGMDENYYLQSSIYNNNNNKTILTTNTIWGALRGLETFSQLIIYNFTIGYYFSYNFNIFDSPRFSHRGLLIDSSRHFLPINIIKSIINSMSYSKLNTLHWHIIDRNGFPYQSLVYPKLWNGAYSMYEKYSQNDIKYVVNYAKYRGIRVLPEFDMPGHGESWCIGYPEICPSPTCLTPLNPAVNITWELIDGIINEAVNSVFIDNYVHLGGDEVVTKCWHKTQSIVLWMKLNNYTPQQSLEYFYKRAQSIVYNKYNKNVINWVEVFDLFKNTLNPNITTIQIWKSKSSLIEVVNMGFNAILSNIDHWYLNMPKITWKQAYLNEPFDGINNIKQQSLILGGEGCMWGNVYDASDYQQMIWPRAAAIAERLWSPRYVNNTKNAYHRLSYFRCLLNQRGIEAAPTNNSQAAEAPVGPGSCYDQLTESTDIIPTNVSSNIYVSNATLINSYPTTQVPIKDNVSSNVYVSNVALINNYSTIEVPIKDNLSGNKFIIVTNILYFCGELIVILVICLLYRSKKRKTKQSKVKIDIEDTEIAVVERAPLLK